MALPSCLIGRQRYSSYFFEKSYQLWERQFSETFCQLREVLLIPTNDNIPHFKLDTMAGTLAYSLLSIQL